jgi:GT2 family glycosyltransferase
VISYTKPFNYSAINNFAVAEAKGALIGLVNNDIEVMAPDWLGEMVSWAIQPDIGCVGANITPTKRSSMRVAFWASAASPITLARQASSRFCYFGQASVIRNCSAVTAACLVVRKAVFEQVGGLDEIGLQIAFNDIDFCMRVWQAGYANVYALCRLYHLESQSRGYEDNPKRWRASTAKSATCAVDGAVPRQRPVLLHQPSRKGPPYAIAV